MSKQAESRGSRIKKLRRGILEFNAAEDDLERQVGKIRSDKQKLLEELQEICPHRAGFEFTDVKWKDPGRKTVDIGTLRVCQGCNLVESQPYRKLSAALVKSVPYADMHRYAVLGRKLSA